MIDDDTGNARWKMFDSIYVKSFTIYRQNCYLRQDSVDP